MSKERAEAQIWQALTEKKEATVEELYQYNTEDKEAFSSALAELIVCGYLLVSRTGTIYQPDLSGIPLSERKKLFKEASKSDIERMKQVIYRLLS